MRYITKLLAGTFLAFGLFGCETFSPERPSQAQIQSDETNLATQTNVVVLVRTHQEANRLLINAARRGYQLNERSDMAGLDLILLDFERPKGVSGDIAISDMKAMEPSASAGLDHFYTLQSQDASTRPQSPRLYAQSMLAWPDTGCEAQITIGMIDGDIDPSSPSLQGAQIVKQVFSKGVAGAGVHGNAIADILVGEGRLKNATLYSASVVTNNRSAQEGAGVPELVRAIDWMQSNNVQLVNISLAGPYNAILDRAVQRAADKGMIMIAAVGNDGPDATPRYPAAFESVIAVTAVDYTRNIYARAVRGYHVDFSAPGVDVFVNDGERSQYLSGTSVAAPFVTALIASDEDFVAQRDVKVLRRHIALSALDLGPSGDDPVYGRGLARSAGNCKRPG